jgi:hypothetical protein
MVNQLPIRTPRRLAPLTRRIPAARSGAQESRIGGFISKTPHCGQGDIDRGGHEVFLFEKEPVAKDNSSVERKTRSEQYHPINSSMA